MRFVLGRDFLDHRAAALTWVLFNAHRAKDTPSVPVTAFMNPGCATRERVRAAARTGVQPAGRAPAAAAPTPRDGAPRVIQPAWAKSGDELWAKMDALQASAGFRGKVN